jgi:hypothetical protein
MTIISTRSLRLLSRRSAITIAALAAPAVVGATFVAPAGADADGTSAGYAVVRPAAATGSLRGDLLPASAYPRFGDDVSWRRTRTTTKQLHAICIPKLPAGRKITSVNRLPHTSAEVRALQTVVELKSATAARRAGLAVSRHVRDCDAKDTRVHVGKRTRTTRLYDTVTVKPGAEEGLFGYIGIGWKGDRLTVTYLGHGGQDSDFPDGTFEKWIKRATARLG